MSPLTLEMLCWLYCGRSMKDMPGFYNESQQNIIAQFHEEGIAENKIIKGNNEWKCTPLGEAWLRAILNTPIPEMRFIDPRTKEIIET